MAELLAVFVLGLLSSAHCIGMCGGFAAAIVATGQPLWPNLSRQLVYSLGRVTTYTFLGAAAGFAGLYLARYNTALISVQRIFSLLAGVLMVAIGASVLGVFRWNRAVTAGGGGDLFAPLFRQFLNARGPTGFLLGGLANGFLPCGLVYAFVARAVATQSMADGATLMLAFGLGTVPAMTAIGCGSIILSRAARHRVYQLAAGLVILVGAITIGRALITTPDGASCHDPTVAMRHSPSRAA